MQIHGNARLLPRQRTLMCERVRHEGWTIEEAADAVGVSTRTVFRWLARWDRGEPMTGQQVRARDMPEPPRPDLWRQESLGTRRNVRVLQREGLNSQLRRGDRLWRVAPW